MNLTFKDVAVWLLHGYGFNHTAGPDCFDRWTDEDHTKTAGNSAAYKTPRAPSSPGNNSNGVKTQIVAGLS